MKIAVLAPLCSKGGGVYSVAHKLASLLAGRGHVLVAAGPYHSSDPPAERWSFCEGVLGLGGPGSLRGLRLFSWLRREQPLVVHVHGLWTPEFVVGGLYALMNRRRLVVTPHGMLDAWALRNGRIRKWLFLRLFGGAFLRAAHCVHCLNVAEQRSVQVSVGECRFVVIPNGCDLSMVRSDWCARRPQVLYFGRLHPKKGVAELLAAWRSARVGDWQLRIAGWGEPHHEEEIASLVESADGSVSLEGPIFGDDINRFLQSGRFLFLPSFSEGLPMVVLEALANGTPAAVTAECNMEDVVDAGAAVLIENRSEGLIAALRHCQRMSEPLWTTMSHAGLQLVRERYDWHSIVRQLDEAMQ